MQEVGLMMGQVGQMSDNIARVLETVTRMEKEQGEISERLVKVETKQETLSKSVDSIKNVESKFVNDLASHSQTIMKSVDGKLGNYVKVSDVKLMLSFEQMLSKTYPYVVLTIAGLVVVMWYILQNDLKDRFGI
jgi:DNA-binding protein